LAGVQRRPACLGKTNTKATAGEAGEKKASPPVRREKRVPDDMYVWSRRERRVPVDMYVWCAFEI